MKHILPLALALSICTAVANDTALQEGNSGPEPIGGTKGPESVVRMVSEELHIDFGRKESDVRIVFTFRSTKEGAPAVQTLGFPDYGAGQVEAERRDPTREKIFAAEHETPLTGPLKNVRTFVNGEEKKSPIRFGWVHYENDFYSPVQKPGKDDCLMAWHTVDVTFPPGEEVKVERRYHITNGSQVFDTFFFHYTTATGGVWNGTIGRLEATVTCKGGLTIDDLAWKGDKRLHRVQSGEGALVCTPGKKEWTMASDKQMKLVWENFEPRTDENRRFFQIATRAAKPPEKTMNKPVQRAR